jgi:hypothetical protein
MSRRQRQRDELHQLCYFGAVARAVDLAFQHFADFGPDDDILALIGDALDRTGAPQSVRQRFAQLKDSAS